MKSKNKVAKTMAIGLATVMLAGTSAACAAKKKVYDEGTIVISVCDSGWGATWTERMAEEFIKDYPQYKVAIEADISEGDIAAILSNPDHDADLIMGSNNGALELYATSYEPLDEIVNSVYPGESKTIGQKIGDDMLALLVNKDGHYDKLCFGTGFYNIVYKSDILEDEEYGFSIPNTTDEFIELVAQMRQYRIVPFMNFTGGGYWHAMLWTWAIQYAGTEAFYDMSINPTKAKLTDDNNGISQGLEVMYDLIHDRKNCDTLSGGQFSEAQTAFLTPSKKLGRSVAMMVNGYWLENEMQKNNAEYEMETNLKVMKTPVVSSIIEKCSTINDDETLSKVIAAIDNGETSYSGVSEKDFNKIAAARRYEVTNAPSLEICIPKFCDQKDGAKEFVKFFYSDKGLKIWFETMGLRQFASFDDESIQLDTSKLSTFQKSCADLFARSTPVAEGRPHSSHQIFIKGGASLVGDNNYAIRLTDGSNITRTDVWTEIKKTNAKNWSTWWKNAGLTEPAE
jgi:ABC-type glycerol-3-phosphate transport system substrate-binding protein